MGPDSVISTDPSDPASGPPLRIIGFVTSGFGLGIAAGNSVRVLIESGIPGGVLDIDPGGRRQGRDCRYADVPQLPTGAPAVDVFHVLPGDLVALARQWLPQVDLKSDLLACVPFWELPRLPRHWLPVLAGFDIVLAPTAFIEEACRADLSRPVLRLPQAVFLPDGVGADRARWNLPDDAFVCLIVADAESDLERKNPGASVRAFLEAFGDDERAILVVKLNRSANYEQHREGLDQLLSSARGAANVRLDEDNLAYADMLSLTASCDVMLSLHRSEGLGLPLMEAMTLGKVAVATGWSGNMDFMTGENARPVPYRLIPVASTHTAYAAEASRPEQVWAEPDAGAAAAILRELAEDPALREELGGRAAESMRKRREEVLRGDTFRRLQMLARDPGTRADASARDRLSAQAAQVARGSRGWRRIARGMLRRLGVRR